MSNNYKKFRDMLPAVASILDLSGAADEIESIKDLGYEEDFDGVYTGKIFFNMKESQINEVVEELFEALVSEGLMYACFEEGTQIGKFINEDAGFDVIEVFDDGVICKKIAAGSFNIFNMMC